MTEKLCPFSNRFKDCRKEECALWTDSYWTTSQTCAVTAIAEALGFIIRRLDK